MSSSDIVHPMGLAHGAVIAVTIIIEVFAFLKVVKQSRLTHHLFLITSIMVASVCNFMYKLIADFADDEENFFMYTFFFLTNFTMLSVFWHMAMTYWKVASEVPKMLLGVDRDPNAHRYLVVNILGFGVVFSYSVWATVNYSHRGIYASGYFGLLVTKVVFLILMLDGIRLNMHAVETMCRRPVDYKEVTLHVIFILFVMAALIMECFMTGPEDDGTWYILNYLLYAISIWVLMFVLTTQARLYKITQEPHVLNGINVIQYQVYCDEKLIYRWQVIPQQKVLENSEREGPHSREVTQLETVQLSNEMKTAVAIFFGFVSKRALPPVDRPVTPSLEDMTRFDASRTLIPQTNTNVTNPSNMSYAQAQSQPRTQDTQQNSYLVSQQEQSAYDQQNQQQPLLSQDQIE